MMHYESLKILSNGMEILPVEDDFHFRAVDGIAISSLSIPWHWHSEAEFITVTSGFLDLHIPGHLLEIPSGHSIFINSGVSHALTVHEGFEAGFTHTIQFPKDFLSAPGSKIDLKYCAPVFSCTELSAYAISAETPSGRRITSLLENVYQTAARQDFLFETRIQQQILEMWTLFVSETRSIWEQSANRSDIHSERIKTMLLFIRQHSAEKLSLNDIADSANISSRECLRCFQKLLRTTPFDFLQECRIRNAVDLLQNSDRSITEISEMCGFSSSSYFAYVFRQVMKLSPREFRKISVHIQ